jgi:hypothetical protein
MSALASSLRRIWSAKNRIPRLTGRGISGGCAASAQSTATFLWAEERLIHLDDIFRRTAPTIVLVALNIFR